MNTALAIQSLYPDADPIRDFRVELRDGAQVIARWDLPGSRPTAEQLADAWVSVQARQAAVSALWNARLAMADAWGQLPADVRADHAHDYASIEASLIRGDIEAARMRIERVELTTEREQYRAQFLALFPE